MNTKEVIADMLTENTGAHFLDSGGAYGRNHERNQGVDFEATPYASVEFSVYSHGQGAPKHEIQFSNNVYHWLAERLDYEPEMTRAYEAWCEREDLAPCLQGQQAVLDSMQRDPGVSEIFGLDWGAEASGLYGEGDPFIVNTYNHESTLSQVLQFLYFEVNGSSYVLLSIHGGCDVRGGYTDCKVFSCNECHDLGILMDRDAHLGCDSCDAGWYSDDAGYHWYAGNSEGSFPEDAFQLDSDKVEAYEEAAEDDNLNPLTIPEGALVISDEGVAYCPECHIGKLGA